MYITQIINYNFCNIHNHLKKIFNYSKDKIFFYKFFFNKFNIEKHAQDSNLGYTYAFIKISNKITKM